MPLSEPVETVRPIIPWIDHVENMTHAEVRKFVGNSQCMPLVGSMFAVVIAGICCLTWALSYLCYNNKQMRTTTTKHIVVL